MSRLMNALMSGVKTKPQDVSFDTLFVTPEMAEKYLELNVKNRPLSKSHINNLAEALIRDEWKVTAEPIKFSDDNLLIDGQHRLEAIVQSGKGAMLSIARNVPSDSFNAMDRVRPRTSADVLAMLDVKYYSTVASGLRLYLQFKKKGADDGVNFSYAASSQEIQECMNQNPTVHEWAKFSYTGIKQILSPKILVGLGLLFAEKDPAFAKAFFDKLATGEGLRKGDPVLTLRDRLMLNRYNTAKLHSRYIIMMVVKCWNASRRGKSISVIRLGDDEKTQDII